MHTRDHDDDVDDQDEASGKCNVEKKAIDLSSFFSLVKAKDGEQRQQNNVAEDVDTR